MSEIQIKFVLLGDQAVGKSSIANRYINNKYEETYNMTLTGIFSKKDLQFQNKSNRIISINIWDTAGQERYRTLLPSFYRDAQIAILVYDITNKLSLDNLEFWLNELREKVEKDNLIIGLACNKIDVEEDQQQVSINMGSLFAKSHNIPFMRVSALTGLGIW